MGIGGKCAAYSPFTLIYMSSMTSKQRKRMIEGWVKEINPKAILRAADSRCGARYAVYVVPTPGEFGTRCTDYLPLEQLEHYLLGVLDANEFNKRMGRIV